jgi:hypothetical protein
MALNFPDAPTSGQVYSGFKWDGVKWVSAPTAGDPQKLNAVGGQTITGGFNFQPYALPAGNVTVNSLNGNYQWRINNGAFSIVAPALDSAVDILITNTSTAGGIAFTGFTVGNNTGDLLTIADGASFIISIRRINGISTYVIKALQ